PVERRVAVFRKELDLLVGREGAGVAIDRVAIAPARQQVGAVRHAVHRIVLAQRTIIGKRIVDEVRRQALEVEGARRVGGLAGGECARCRHSASQVHPFRPCAQRYGACLGSILDPKTSSCSASNRPLCATKRSDLCGCRSSHMPMTRTVRSPVSCHCSASGGRCLTRRSWGSSPNCRLTSLTTRPSKLPKCRSFSSPSTNSGLS